VTAQRLGEAWGHTVVVENNSGGATTIGTNAVARAAPDGHKMLLTTVNFAFIPAIYPKLPYDPKNDFAPVGIEPGGGSEEKFAAYLASEFDKWRKVAREANIKMD
jgi:tripartite-type tricarboxylate transporter receptor subunit TctC